MSSHFLTPTYQATQDCLFLLDFVDAWPAEVVIHILITERRRVIYPEYADKLVTEDRAQMATPQAGVFFPLVTHY